MGEPNTYEPLISLTDEGIIQFELGSEGVFITFDVDIDEVPNIIDRLRKLEAAHEEWRQKL